tara:strand:+ start:1121 stop:1543 length:423 start_codon:yes stop_codon:yes gene_type:complete
MADEENNARSLASINVLVVEDEKYSVIFVTSVLEAIGIVNVAVAENGIEALEKMASGDVSVDIVICDLEMPEMGGFEFIREVRYGTVPQFKDVPILVLTGKDNDQNINMARIHKIEGFLVKPPDIKTLERYIREIFDIAP